VGGRPHEREVWISGWREGCADTNGYYVTFVKRVAVFCASEPPVINNRSKILLGDSVNRSYAGIQAFAPVLVAVKTNHGETCFGGFDCKWHADIAQTYYAKNR
jgi:hypothetical protein